MGLNKRVLNQTTVDFVPAVEKANGNPERVMQASEHQAMAVVLEHLTNLLGFASELYQGLFDDLSATTKRIHDLNTRVGAVTEFMPALEEYVSAAEGEVFITKGGSSFSADPREDAQLLRTATRTSAILDVYETRCIPPPDLSALDMYREDGGKCLKDYTNPDFFVQAWIEEQKKKAKEARQRRQNREKNPKSATGKNLRKATEEQQVTKLKKTRWNQWGEKIEDGEDDGSSAAPSRGVTPRVQVATSQAEVTTPRSQPASARRPLTSTNSSNNIPTTPTASPSPAATRTESPKPAPAQEPALAKSNSSLSDSRRGKKDDKKKDKKEKKKEKKDKKKDAKKPPAKGSSRASVKTEPVKAPEPAKVEKTPEAPAAPAAPAAPTPAKPQFSIPSAPPAPSAPAPPPPPGAPPPPAPALVIPDAPQVGADEKRSDLLLQIQAGKQLKKAQERKMEPKETRDDGTINVAAILQRRMAFEFSDDEDEGGEEGGDWDDDEDGDF